MPGTSRTAQESLQRDLEAAGESVIGSGPEHKHIHGHIYAARDEEEGFLRPDPMRTGTNLSVASRGRLTPEEVLALLGEDDADQKVKGAVGGGATGVLNVVLHALGIRELQAAAGNEDPDEDRNDEPARSETSSLLPRSRHGKEKGHRTANAGGSIRSIGNGSGKGNGIRPSSPNSYVEGLDRRFEAALASGKIHTTYWRESKLIWRNAVGPALTYVLQRSLSFVGVLFVGHMGKAELAAIALANMIVYLSGYSIFVGLTTSLDTLCGQAYGAGRYHLVGLSVQRMVCFLWVVSIPITTFWFFSERPLACLVEPRIAQLTTGYLRIVIPTVPAYAVWEASRRFLQSQGLFFAATHVLLMTAPLNLLLHWFFIFELKWGFMGSPIAACIVGVLQPCLIVLYVRFVAGRKCWGGVSARALTDWGPMLRLSGPGFVMMYAEFFAFEVLTLAASHFSTEHLTASSILMNLISFTYQGPLGVAISSSTRISNLIGAGLPYAAKVSAKAAINTGIFLGSCSTVIVLLFHDRIVRFFTDAEDVIAIFNSTVWVIAAFQVLDATAAQTNGILRGLGMQHVGSRAQLFAFYAIGLPISFGTAFGLNWKLSGFFGGIGIALGTVILSEGLYISYSKTVWTKAVDMAHARNAVG